MISVLAEGEYDLLGHWSTYFNCSIT